MYYKIRILFFVSILLTFLLVWMYTSIYDTSTSSFLSIKKSQNLNLSLVSKTSPNNNVLSSLSLSSKNESIQAWNDSTSSKIAAENNTFISASQKLPLILAFRLFLQMMENMDLKQYFLEGIEKCKYKCEYSENPTLYPVADVALFHSNDFVTNASMFLTNKNYNPLNVFLSLESFAHDKMSGKNIPKDFFNATMSFRRDSTIWSPYDKFEEFQPHEKDNDTLVWSDTQDPASHGFCYNRSAEKDENMMKAEVDKHYFFLAFENSVCKDYVTEKFWRIKDLIVPVVLKRSILEGIVEDEYFIAADDFKTPKELAEKLINLTQNLDEYKKYLGWTKKYKKILFSDWSNMFCKLCEMATKKEKHEIKDIYQWWENDAKCEAQFALKLLSSSKN